MLYNNLTYAIYKNTPALSRPAFANVRNQGVVEFFDHLRQSIDTNKIILKWRQEQPLGLAVGLVLWTGTHAQIVQKLIDDDDEWGGDP